MVWNYSLVAFLFTNVLISFSVVLLYNYNSRPLNHLLGDYAKLLSPKDPIHAMSLVIVYLTLGAILLLLAIGQPWFVYEMDYEYYNGPAGPFDGFTYHYDLNGISVEIDEESDLANVYDYYPYPVYPNFSIRN